MSFTSEMKSLPRLLGDQPFVKAITERRIVLTIDLDFGEIAVRCADTGTSVIVFRLANATSPHVIERLDMTPPRLGDALDKGAVVVVEETRVRIRRIPIQPN